MLRKLKLIVDFLWLFCFVLMFLNLQILLYQYTTTIKFFSGSERVFNIQKQKNT